MSIDHEAVKADAERTRDGLGPIWASWVSDLALAYLDLAAQLEACKADVSKAIANHSSDLQALEAARKAISEASFFLDQSAIERHVVARNEAFDKARDILNAAIDAAMRDQQSTDLGGSGQPESQP